ncbi:hypothetical protein MTO96_049285 [Rhipicephalus appendiculatus]
MGTLCRLYKEIFESLQANAIQPSPRQRPPVPVTTELPKVTKRHSSTCALIHMAASLRHESRANQLHVYVGHPEHLFINGSLRHLCAAEEQNVPSTSTRELDHCRGWLSTCWRGSVGIFCDSKAALLSDLTARAWVWPFYQLDWL